MARPLTPHYSIPQYGPQGTHDPMAAYSVYNVAMKIIDDILFELKGLIDGLDNRLTIVEGDVEQLQQDVTNINQNIQEMGDKYDAAIQDILNKFYGGGSIGDDGHVDWGDPNKAAVGNMNVYGNNAKSSYIRTASGDPENSVRVR